MYKKHYFFITLCLLSTQLLYLTASESRVVLAMEEAQFQGLIRSLIEPSASSRDNIWCGINLFLASKPLQHASSPVNSPSNAAPPPLNRHPLFSSQLIQSLFSKTPLSHQETLKELLLRVYQQEQQAKRLEGRAKEQQKKLEKLQAKLQDPLGIRAQRNPPQPKAPRGDAYRRLTPRTDS